MEIKTARKVDKPWGHEEIFAETGKYVGKILFTSPLAQGLVGKGIGDKVEIDVPQGTLKFEVLEIRFEE